MAISGRHPRSVPAAVKTVLAPRFVIARRPEADVTISGRHPRSVPAAVKTVLAPPTCHCEEAGGRRGNLGKALPFGTSHRKNGTHLRFVIARSEATWQSREGTPDPYRPPLKQCWPPDLSLRGGRRPTWQSREGTPDPYWPPLKQCWPPDLSLRGGRRPTWQSRSTRSDNRKASANSTPRKAVKA